MKKNIAEILKKIDKDHYSLLIDIGNVSKELGLRSYLVGGMVRDLLLSSNNLDIDIVVEDHAKDSPAKRLADGLVRKSSNYELSAKHDRFHTAKVIFNVNGKKIPIDLASTREENYKESAGLPDITLTNLKNDLKRRDFTINALAVSLMPDDFGEVEDFFNGLEDLELKKINIVPNEGRLQNNTFIEDPTRMIRAVRFACKLGFKIEENTWKLLKETMDSGVFDNLIEKIRGDRVKIEIRYLFNLSNVEEAVKEFFESGIYRMVSTELNSRSDAINRVTIGNDMPNQWLIYLAIVMKDLNPGMQEQIMKNLQMPGDEIKVIRSGFNVLNKLNGNSSINPMLVYRELKNLSMESIVMVKMLSVIARSETTKQSQNREEVNEIALDSRPRNDMNELALLIDEYLSKTSKIKLEITGQDLINIGVQEGKKIGEILDKVLEMKIKNPNMSKQDEEREVKNLI